MRFLATPRPRCHDCQTVIEFADEHTTVMVDHVSYKFHTFCVKAILQQQIRNEIARDVHTTILQARLLGKEN